MANFAGLLHDEIERVARSWRQLVVCDERSRSSSAASRQSEEVRARGPRIVRAEGRLGVQPRLPQEKSEPSEQAEGCPARLSRSFSVSRPAPSSDGRRAGRNPARRRSIGLENWRGGR
jgi:hypothetical protein